MAAMSPSGALVRSSAGYSRNEFTYTLMDEGDLQR